MTHNLSAERLALRDELLAERELSIDDFWTRTEARLDWPLEKGINLAHECCDRWAGDRARIALSVHEPDGGVRRWTFDELTRASSAVANLFELKGLRRGDRIAAVLDQQVEAYVVALAAWRAGMVYVPLFVGFGVDALAHRIGSAECAAIVVGHKYREVVTGVQGKLGDDAQVITVAGPDGAGVLDGDVDLWGEVAGVSHEHEVVVTAPDDVATIIFTSGTTGDPKGCLHPHGALVLGLQTFLRHTMALTCEDVVFAGANPGWSFGLYTAGLGVQSLGIPRVIYTGAFDPEAWLRVMEAERVTYVATAPSAYRPLITHLSTTGRTLPDSIRGAVSAGEPLTTAITDGWSGVGGGRLQDGYGSSEMGMVLANLAFEEREVPPGALSSPVPGFDVDIVDDKGQPTEGEGMIGVRDMRWPIGGYKDLEETWAAKTVDGVFLSGDLARRDEKGFYWFAGRSDDLIVTAGYNVGPSEVENIISALPGVLDVAVVGAPDPDRGSVVRAVIVEDGTVPREQIAETAQETVRARLGRHAYPKIVDFVSALPRTETGKVRRNVLRETGLG